MTTTSTAVIMGAAHAAAAQVVALAVTCAGAAVVMGSTGVCHADRQSRPLGVQRVDEGLGDVRGGGGSAQVAGEDAGRRGRLDRGVQPGGLFGQAEVIE